MTDFFERQEKARSRTGLYIGYFLLAVLATILAVYLLLMVFMKGAGGWWRAEVFLFSVVVTGAVIGIGSLVRIMELSSGGGAVARALGGRPVNPQTRDLGERRLLNVVEEMSLASGVPVPEIYVLEEEEGINAFAAGHSPSDAAIGVTRGSLKWLTRDELQGVIAHEFSHILNGDMRLNIRLMGLIGGILALTTIGSVLARSRTRGKSGGQVVLIGLGLLAIGFLGAFFARLIQAAISRQREFLADAAAAQFTRYPAGLAAALKKIGALSQGSIVKAPRAIEAGHLFFSNGLTWSGLTATHPPLIERIRALEPNFDGVFPPVRPPIDETRRAAPPVVTAAGKAKIQPPAIPLPPVLGAVPVGTALAQAGQPAPAQLQFAADLRAGLPAAIAEAVVQPYSATALVYALLLSQDGNLQEAQLQQLGLMTSAGLAEESRRLLSHLRQMPVSTRLPLLDLALPALRQMSTGQYELFQRVVQELVASDEQLDLFEFALQKVLRHHLTPYFSRGAQARVDYYSLKAVKDEVGLLLSALAHAGQSDPARAKEAFQEGVAQLKPRGFDLPFVAWDQCHPGNLDAALDKCAAALPIIRAQILNAMTHAVAADGVIRLEEAELIRAFADTLECPLPPFLQTSLP